MARPRKPTSVLQLRGSFKHNPDRGRARENEPQPTAEISAAPAHFDETQAACYDELVRRAHAGVLCDSDGVAVEVGAVLLARLRTKTDEFTVGEFGRLQAVLGALGMTPADRSKVSALKPKDDGPDPLAEFFRA